MPYAMPSFDELLNSILTDYRNQFPGIDTSKGTLVFIKSACYASALWGLYHHQGWIADQMFPDSADADYLDHHGWVRGIARTYGEQDDAYLARILADIRRPPAGGNQYDYVQWAESIDGVAAAYCFPIAQGLGTVDVVIIANEATTGSELPSSSARTGQVTTVTAGKLIDAAATFNAANEAVSPGDLVRNTVQGLETVVVSVDGATQLTLAADIFKYVGQGYNVHFHCGTATTLSAGKLIDAAAKFNDGTYVARPGDLVQNVTDGTSTTVVSIDSATQLTLTADIFGAVGNTYVLRGLVARVKEYVDGVRPVTASLVRVLGPTIVTQAVTGATVGIGKNPAQTALDIAAYLQTLIPGQTLYVAKLASIGIDDGADNMTISLPVADVAPAGYQMIRPGVISVT